MVPRLCNIREVAAARGCSRGTVYNHIDAGLFPKPVKLNHWQCRWPESEVLAVTQAVISGKSTDEVKALVRELEVKRHESAQEAA